MFQSRRSPDHSPLTTYERAGILAILLIILGLGVVIEIRSAFLRRHMTDLNVYLRAAWAVRVGEDIYDIVDDNRWHYQYPPLFAILMTPLANPPPGADRAGMLPFGVSVVLWYVFSVVCLGLSLHLLAGILEGRCGDPDSGRRRWWLFRVLPLLICIVPTIHTLTRGQVSLLLLLLLCGCAAALERGKPLRAGLWLAGAICLKVIPAMLVALPFVRRDRRCLAGCFLGLVVGLGIIPAAVFGWPRTVRYYVEYDRKVLRPGLGDDRDQARALELTDTVSTDSQSIVAMLHNTLHFDRATRPRNASPLLRRCHWAGGFTLLSLTVLSGWRSMNAAGRADVVIFLGALIFNMLVLSPVCHLHYFCLMIPLVMGLLAAWWHKPERSEWLSCVPVLCVIHFLTSLLPVIPGLHLLRDIGLATYGAAPLWVAGCAVLWTDRHIEAGQGKIAIRFDEAALERV